MVDFDRREPVPHPNTPEEQRAAVATVRRHVEPEHVPEILECLGLEDVA